MSAPKKIGITIDDYKEKEFKRLLDKDNYIYEVKRLRPGVKFIMVMTDEDHVMPLAKLCSIGQINTKQAN